MTTIITHEEEYKIAHKKACAYLKGFVVGHAVINGMKWGGDSSRTPEFNEGYNDGQKTSSACITYAHILHNRLRHNRPHRTSGELNHQYLVDSDDPGRFDQDHIQYMLWEYTGWTSMFNDKLESLGFQVKSLLKFGEA